MSENAGPSSARREHRQASSSPRAVRRVPPPPPPPPPPLEPPEPTAPIKPAPKLPAELIQSIVDYACEDLQPLAERKTCRNLALIGRDWRETAQRRIFREVAIVSTQALARAATIFSQSPRQVGRFVRDLSLHFTLEELRQEDLSQLYHSCGQLGSLHLTATYENMRTLVSTLPSTPAGRGLGSVRLRLAELVTPTVDLAFFDTIASLPNVQRCEVVAAEAVTLASTRINGRLSLTQLHIGFPPEDAIDCSKRLIKYGTPQADFSKLKAGDLCFERLGKRMMEAVRTASTMTSLRVFDCKREDIIDICDILDTCPVLEHLDIEGETLSVNETQVLLEAIPPSLVTATLDLGDTFKNAIKYQHLHDFLKLRKSSALTKVRLAFNKHFELWEKKESEKGLVWQRVRLYESSGND